MDVFDFDSSVDRRGSLSLKWDSQEIKSICGNGQALPYWVADMDFTVPPAISEALKAQADHAVLGYPKFTNLQETFCAWARLRHHWQVDKEAVSIAPGMLGSLALLVESLTKEGDGVIVPIPAYQPFIRMVNQLSRKLVLWPMSYNRESAHFSLDFTLMEQLMADTHNRVLLFCSPHNPSGTVFSEEDLAKVAQCAAKNQITVLSDEIHADLAFPESHHIPFNMVAHEQGCVAVTCMAPSKTFNIAGEHFSVAVFSDHAMASRFNDRLRALFLGTGLLSTVAAVAGYQQGYAWLMDLTRHLVGQVDYIDNYLHAHLPLLRLVKPGASFIGFIDCTGIVAAVERDAQANPQLYDPKESPQGGLLSRFFGQRAGIVVNDGSWFGKPYGNFIRFNYGTSRHQVETALHQMEQAVLALH